jgi:hypothetical protein
MQAGAIVLARAHRALIRWCGGRGGVSHERSQDLIAPLRRECIGDLPLVLPQVRAGLSDPRE